jgi:hypothetical protein
VGYGYQINLNPISEKEWGFVLSVGEKGERQRLECTFPLLCEFLRRIK